MTIDIKNKSANTKELNINNKRSSKLNVNMRPKNKSSYGISISSNISKQKFLSSTIKYKLNKNKR